ncbi:hypothetical protein BCO_0900016 [Borrelia coriaceae ATCC 43381]|uniref:Uncharacterized protein n=1 Tax=Borrelia coriaceae ATCC 43381 TaxID=1408429 RepID=W5SV04_9SPIR|nr:hypothetical protein BCO_0900016 [Borrelia coriaceae ATCC 43381]
MFISLFLSFNNLGEKVEELEKKNSYSQWLI